MQYLGWPCSFKNIIETFNNIDRIRTRTGKASTVRYQFLYVTFCLKKMHIFYNDSAKWLILAYCKIDMLYVDQNVCPVTLNSLQRSPRRRQYGDDGSDNTTVFPFVFFAVTCPRLPVFARPNKYSSQTFAKHKHYIQSFSVNSPNFS